MRAALPIEPVRGIVLRETLISTLPNAVVSAGFVWLLFREQATIPLWGMNGLAFDLVPTTFMLTLMTTIALTLVFRKRRRDGVLPSAGASPAPLALPHNPLLRGLVFGIGLLLLFVPISVFALSAIWRGDWTYAEVLAFKIVYGVLVGWAATPLVVLAVMREGNR
ncbi:hypothetical protein J3454_13360 [Erythrobacter sp. NFXS35]|uniref:hypothetical protein n=1 Tax=Erythrobacter sp. NFXS35 TaxID=2818436 RepID=UPI0032DEB300